MHSAPTDSAHLKSRYILKSVFRKGEYVFCDLRLKVDWLIVSTESTLALETIRFEDKGIDSFTHHQEAYYLRQMILTSFFLTNSPATLLDCDFFHTSRPFWIETIFRMKFSQRLYFVRAALITGKDLILYSYICLANTIYRHRHHHSCRGFTAITPTLYFASNATPAPSRRLFCVFQPFVAFGSEFLVTRGVAWRSLLSWHGDVELINLRWLPTRLTELRK